jgi:hypothetical protein
MDDLSVLGNAAAVPIVITITQIIKRNVNWKRAPELISLGVALVLCLCWSLYEITQEEMNALILSGPLGFFKWTVTNMIVGFATWLSASKLYDLGYGEKKTQRKFEEISKQKDVLHEEIRRLSDFASGEEGGNESVEEDSNLSNKLEDILEGRG